MPYLSEFEQAAASKSDRSELRLWGLLSAGSLAIAGIFALLLAFSRIPGSHNLLAWPADFFNKGLVIHVIFSFVVWFLAVFAMLSSLATFQIGGKRAAWMGKAGAYLSAIAFPLLFFPAFTDAANASLNNYIPAIIHPLYYAGLGLLGLGVLLPVLRLFVNLPGRAQTTLSFAMSAGGVIYFTALVCTGLAFTKLFGGSPTETFNENLFWGGGHVMQFLNTGLMLTCWFVQARLCLGQDVLSESIFRLALVILTLFALPAIGFYMVFEAFSPLQTEAFTLLQYVFAFPTLLVAIGGLAGLMNLKKYPWSNPVFLALVLSPIVFGVGGIMGLMVDGTDTRTPAHYHGVIDGVNVAIMGIFLGLILPIITGRTFQGRAIKAQILMFGIGQIIASIGLFVAGGYGAPRKAASDIVVLVDVAKIGLYLNGIGALIAVIGGVMFIWTVLRALLASDKGSPQTQ